MKFGDAVEQAKQGHRIARSGWNGKGMYVFYVTEGGWDYTRMAFMVEAIKSSNSINGPFLVMKTADDKNTPWLASQTDVLAEDWSIIQD